MFGIMGGFAKRIAGAIVGVGCGGDVGVNCVSCASNSDAALAATMPKAETIPMMNTRLKRCMNFLRGLEPGKER